MEKKARRKMARKRKQRKRRREWQWDESAEPEDSEGQGKDMAGGGWRGWEEVLHGFDMHGKEKGTWGRNWSTDPPFGETSKWAYTWRGERYMLTGLCYICTYFFPHL